MATNRSSWNSAGIRDAYFQQTLYTYVSVRNKYNVVGNEVEEYREVKVHTFRMGDVEDPDIYAAQPLYDWQQSPQGQWIMAHAVETPSWHRQHDVFGCKYTITAKLSGKDLTFFYLKWEEVVDKHIY